MIDVNSNDSLLNRAFNLACFIVGDREAALRVVTGALAKLQVAVCTQGKRLYYRPIGRGSSQNANSKRSRNNISFNETHLLQRLIYLESEPYEIALEQGKSSPTATEEDLVIHFVKHLTKKTIKRNSFYVTLGLSRLLHSYTTAETMEIYNAVIQDPDRVKDDYYYRSRKGVLVQELKQRFGDLINICRGPRGEERFQPDDNQHRFIELVRECLDYFTPWQTPCLVPADIHPIMDGIPSFSAINENDEDNVEVHRIHAVLHPACFQRLMANLRLDAPETRLEIPRFFYANENGNGSGNGSDSNRRNPRELDERELQSITSSLESNAARRRTASAGLLRIVVDGVERGRIDLDKTSSTRFRLDSDAELIEVCSCDNLGEELLLASHLLTDDDHDGLNAIDASIILEGGQKILIHTMPQLSEKGATVEISYRETNPFRAMSLLFRQLALSLNGRASRSLWKDRRVFVPAVVIGFVISFAVLMKYIRRENSGATEPNQIAVTQQKDQTKDETQSTKAGADNRATSPAGETNLPKSSNPPQGSEGHQQRQNVGPSSKIENNARNSVQKKADLATGPGTVSETETRSISAVRATPLSAVTKVYVEVVGDETLGQSVRQTLAERLRASNQIILAHNRGEANALLKVAVMRISSGEPEKTKTLVELINARGNVIWSNPRNKYYGSPADVSANIVRDLLAAIKNSKQRK